MFCVFLVLKHQEQKLSKNKLEQELELEHFAKFCEFLRGGELGLKGHINRYNDNIEKIL